MSLTYKEIMEQYHSMMQTKIYLDEKMPALTDLLDSKKFSSLVVLGCGSSHSLAKSIARMTQMETGFPSVALAAGDVLLHSSRYKKCFEDALVLAVSRSGSTSEILLTINSLKEQNIDFTTVAFTCKEDSQLSRLSDLPLDFPWAYDYSICQTRTVSCFYYAFSYILARFTKDPELLDDLDFIVTNGDNYIKEIDAAMQRLAEKPWSNVVVLGDAELCGIAEEGALAFKEICQLPSNYYNLLDARHGPAVLFNDQTLIVAALGPANNYEMDFLRDMIKKTPHIIAFTDKTFCLAGVDIVPYNRELSHIAKGLPFILICQLVSYYKAVQTGVNPDAPDGLDAWISF